MSRLVDSTKGFTVAALLATAMWFSTAPPPAPWAIRPPLAPVAQRSEDPHDWPEWRKFRYQKEKTKPTLCCWKTCRNQSSHLHHGIGAYWCVAAGRPEAVYSEVPGQWFLWLCQDHHELCHNICEDCGGTWKKFNKDSYHDALYGVWNSRGRSRWEFENDQAAIRWVKQQFEESANEKNRPPPEP
jgi:hypothetical protein